jgi:hypothetical protein
MEVIHVKKLGDATFEVGVQGDRLTTHVVTVDPAYAARLTGNRVPIERLVNRSFEFLLEREPNTSILSRFDLSVISHYFTEYERTIFSWIESMEQLK